MIFLLHLLLLLIQKIIILNHEITIVKQSSTFSSFSSNKSIEKKESIKEYNIINNEDNFICNSKYSDYYDNFYN